MVFHSAIIGNSKYEFNYNPESNAYECQDLTDKLQSLVPEILEDELIIGDLEEDAFRIET